MRPTRNSRNRNNNNNNNNNSQREDEPATNEMINTPELELAFKTFISGFPKGMNLNDLSCGKTKKFFEMKELLDCVCEIFVDFSAIIFCLSMKEGSTLKDVEGFCGLFFETMRFKILNDLDLEPFSASEATKLRNIKTLFSKNNVFSNNISFFPLMKEMCFTIQSKEGIGFTLATIMENEPTIKEIKRVLDCVRKFDLNELHEKEEESEDEIPQPVMKVLGQLIKENDKLKRKLKSLGDSGQQPSNIDDKVLSPRDINSLHKTAKRSSANKNHKIDDNIKSCFIKWKEGSQKKTPFGKAGPIFKKPSQNQNPTQHQSTPEPGQVIFQFEEIPATPEINMTITEIEDEETPTCQIKFSDPHICSSQQIASQSGVIDDLLSALQKDKPSNQRNEDEEDNNEEDNRMLSQMSCSSQRSLFPASFFEPEPKLSSLLCFPKSQEPSQTISRSILPFISSQPSSQKYKPDLIKSSKPNKEDFVHLSLSQNQEADRFWNSSQSSSC